MSKTCLPHEGTKTKQWTPVIIDGDLAIITYANHWRMRRLNGWKSIRVVRRSKTSHTWNRSQDASGSFTSRTRHDRSSLSIPADKNAIHSCIETSFIIIWSLHFFSFSHDTPRIFVWWINKRAVPCGSSFWCAILNHMFIDKSNKMTTERIDLVFTKKYSWKSEIDLNSHARMRPPTIKLHKETIKVIERLRNWSIN